MNIENNRLRHGRVDFRHMLRKYNPSYGRSDVGVRVPLVSDAQKCLPGQFYASICVEQSYVYWTVHHCNS